MREDLIEIRRSLDHCARLADVACNELVDLPPSRHLETERKQMREAYAEGCLVLGRLLAEEEEDQQRARERLTRRVDRAEKVVRQALADAPDGRVDMRTLAKDYGIDFESLKTAAERLTLAGSATRSDNHGELWLTPKGGTP